MSTNLIDSTTLFLEGNTEFYVPKNSLTQIPPPRTPVFFNTMAKFKRDLLISIFNSHASQSGHKLTFSDTLSGVGATGIRLANESEYVKKIYFNDANINASELLQTSITHNNLDSTTEVSINEAHKFLSNFTNRDVRFDFIDLDPFGSPIQYVDSAVRALKINGVLSLTATDGAVLCGVYPKVCLRKYGSLSLNTEYFNETALRILIFSLASISSHYELGIKPLFCHTDKHYIQAYVQITDSISDTENRIGFIGHCSTCQNRVISELPILSCNLCSSNNKIAGPLWIGDIFDKSFLNIAINNTDDSNLVKLYRNAISESSLPPLYYVTDTISQNLKISSFPVETILSKLKENNFLSSKTILHSTGFRTDANVEEINSILSKTSTSNI
tara:strand:+ start:63127 stop:64287 length:1161 start_codon:yes stop_codon:yes gene_type:complete